MQASLTTKEISVQIFTSIGPWEEWVNLTYTVPIDEIYLQTYIGCRLNKRLKKRG